MYQSLFNQKSILREIRNYLAGRVVGITRDELLLEEVLKCTITKAMLDEANEIVNDNPELAIKYRQTFKAIEKEFPNVFRNPLILLNDDELLFLHRKLSLIKLKEMPRDFFGDAYEAFIGNNYRGQEGQFFTPNNAVDLLVNVTKPSSDDTILDPACGAGGFLATSLSYINDNENKINQSVYGIDKDQFLAEITKVRLAIQYHSTFNIICSDSLNGDNTFEKLNLSNNKKFTLILTNPPFGSRIVSLAEENKHKFKLAYKWKWDNKTNKFVKTEQLAKNVPPQILFLERCISLLEDKGRLGIVLPESVISSPKYKYVVQYIMEHCTPIAIAGMPEDLFKTSGKGGTHTKVSLVVLQKGKCEPDKFVFMAEAKWCGHDSRGNTIPHDDLPTISQNFTKKRSLEKSKLGFFIKASEIKGHVLAPKYYVIDHEDIFKGLESSHELFKIKDLLEKGYLVINTGDEIGKLSYGTGKIPFIRTSDISNWEIKLDPKHLVDENVYFKLKDKQDVREGDILMVKDGTYLIGTCAIITKHDVKMLYQSHLYKIRVSGDAPFDNYLFLALLSSPAVQSQIKSRSFTQDIINSLGRRIEELIIPIPKSEQVKNQISSKVREVIENKISTRESMHHIRGLLPGLDAEKLP
ncbi:MAG: N-6 DNA methylase [Thermodesulfobacteriota bacterium]